MAQMNAQERLQRAEKLLKEVLSQDLLTDVAPDGQVYCTLCGAEQPSSVAHSGVKRIRVQRAQHAGNCPITHIKDYFADAGLSESGA